jgi:dihydrofolate synthase/folylpolyglutamate synthase
MGSDAVLDRLMRLHPKVIDLVLDRVHRLLAVLDHPEERLPPVIHVAGTNGKGSTLAMIRGGLEAAGDVCHAYTSPHLARFHERIRVAGDLIGEDALADLLAECEATNGGAAITYFEITTCAALLAFARTRADWTLLEVGLGGRLDATNVIAAPALTLITPVDMDHQSFLGDTLPEIAGEKAGILKPGVPCIVGPQHEAALEVIEYRAARLGAPLQVHGQHWHVHEERGRLIFEDETGLMDLPPPRLIGRHQVENAGIAVAALRALGRDGGAAAAMRDADWPARLQRLRSGPLVDAAAPAELWLDGGHNPAAGAALAEALGRLPQRPLHLVCGMLNTKDVAGYLRPLAPMTARLHAVAVPGEAATLPSAETCAAAGRAGIDAVEAPSVAAAVTAIVARDPGARILICGSLYLAGHVLRENG